MICLVGRTGSGKSTVSSIIAERYGTMVYGVGRFEREWFHSLGYNSPVEYHRELGIENTYFGLFPEHIRQIGKIISGGSIIIESVYSPRLVDMLSTNFPNHSISIINIAATRHFRFRLFRLREPYWSLEKAKREFNELERFKFRFGVLEMLRKADITIRNDSSLSSLSSRLDCVERFVRS